MMMMIMIVVVDDDVIIRLSLVGRGNVLTRVCLSVCLAE